MGLNIGPGAGSDEPELMMDINTTPLIDVMLVLLVMLIITIPVQLHAINLALPASVPPENLVRTETIRIDIDAHDVVTWQGEPVDATGLDVRLAAIAQQAVQPELHVRPHAHSRYAVFASVLAASRRNGLGKVAVLGSEQFALPGQRP